MTPLEIAQIQHDAEKAERQRIASNIRLMAAQEEQILNQRHSLTSSQNKAKSILRTFADMIERGEFSQ